MMMLLLRSLTTIIIATATIGHAFVVVHNNHHHLSSSRLDALAYTYSDVSNVGYAIRVSKPLGIVFGENPDPFYGLVVDDVDADMNGGMAGMKVGDQLLAVNGRSYVGASFDKVMSALVAADGDLELQMYRGNVRSLYVILLKQKPSTSEDADETSNDDDDDDGGVIVMDENYESPVQIDLSQFEDKPLTPGDVLKAFKKIGSILTEGDNVVADEVKPKGGFFGLFGGGDAKNEDFFLDENESNSLGGRGGVRKK
jgi:hypothetical protein